MNINILGKENPSCEPMQLVKRRRVTYFSATDFVDDGNVVFTETFKEFHKDTTKYFFLYEEHYRKQWDDCKWCGVLKHCYGCNSLAAERSQEVAFLCEDFLRFLASDLCLTELFKRLNGYNKFSVCQERVEGEMVNLIECRLRDDCRVDRLPQTLENEVEHLVKSCFPSQPLMPWEDPQAFYRHKEIPFPDGIEAMDMLLKKVVTKKAEVCAQAQELLSKIHSNFNSGWY